MSVVPGEASESDEELETVGSSLPDLHGITQINICSKTWTGCRVLFKFS